MVLDANQSIHRLAVYAFTDQEATVDDYVTFYLEELKQCTDRLLVVVYGPVSEVGMGKLKVICPEVVVFAHVGHREAAYRAGLEYLGWDVVAQADELLLSDQSMLGPLAPFDTLLEAMAAKDVAFWGIAGIQAQTADEAGDQPPEPAYLPLRFMVLRQPLLKDEAFAAQWDRASAQAGAQVDFEPAFTAFWEAKGYLWSTYIDTGSLAGFARDPLLMMPDELVIRRGCPVMTWASFSHPYLEVLGCSLGNALADTVSYLKQQARFPVDMVWDHLLRVGHLADIKAALHLNLILPRDHRIDPRGPSHERRVALMMHIYYPDMVEGMLAYALNMPPDAHCYITSPHPQTLQMLDQKAKALPFEKVVVLPMTNRGRDVSALLLALKPFTYDYDVVCFIHDKKTLQAKPYTNGMGFAYKCMENTLGSRDFVENILKTFEDDPRLGMLIPPTPNHGYFFQTISGEWSENFDNTVALMDRVGIQVPVSPDKEPIAPLGTMFWFRTEALRPLLDYPWAEKDFPPEPNGYDGSLLHAVERAYGFAVQQAGYYPAWVMNDRFAALEVTNLHTALRELNHSVYQLDYSPTLPGMKQKIAQYRRFYILGWDRVAYYEHMSRQRMLLELLRPMVPRAIWGKIKTLYYRLFRPQDTSGQA